MKSVFALGILCLAVVSISAGKNSKKSEYQSNWNEDFQDSKYVAESSETNLKKHGKEHKHHHHHYHYAPSDQTDYKSFGKHQEKEKRQKHLPKSAPYDMPVHEAELQSDIKTSRKHLKDQHLKHEKEDLHLQDLTLEANSKPEETQSGKSPHQYQRGHHKSNHKKAPKHDVQVEEKLFDDQVPKESAPKSSPPVLEDSFEALNEDAETKKHTKKANKHKKAYEKVKKEKKPKKDKKEKKQKKDKKEKQKW